MKDVTLSDGTVIPRGTLVCAASGPAHTDPSSYEPDAEEFDPYRFARMREGEGEGTTTQGKCLVEASRAYRWGGGMVSAGGRGGFCGRLEHEGRSYC